MLGNTFNHNCFQITWFADNLRYEIEHPLKTGKIFEPETVSRLITAQQFIAAAGKLAIEIEWLYSGDHGEKDFNDLADKILTRNY